jgi:hypothetical protein
VLSDIGAAASGANSDITQLSGLTTDLSVAQGGTGVSSLTDGGILIGNDTSGIVALGVATNGQIPIGDGTTDPVLNEIDGTANEIEITNGVGTITVGIVTSPTLDASNVTGVPAGAYDAASIDGDDVNSNIAGAGLVLTGASPDTLDTDSTEAGFLSSAAAATITAAGAIGVDTSDDQLVYSDGSDTRVLHYAQTYCAVFEDLAQADDNFEIWMGNDAVTVVAGGCHCRGTCSTAAQISFEDRAGNAMTHGTITCSTGTGNTTFVSVTAANSLSAGEGVAFDTDNALSPETDEYTVCIQVTYDRQ